MPDAPDTQFSAPQLVRLRQAAEEEFQHRFGGKPRFFAAAPGRVNLIGEHIDYNDGLVLPMAIERAVVIAASPCEKSSAAVCYSAEQQSQVEIPLDPAPGPRLSGWGSYLEGVIAGFVRRGIPVPAFQAVLVSSVPLGGGLSSSAALEVAAATLLEAMTQTSLDPREKALLCQWAEHHYPGMPCGIMDQFSSVFGRADQLLLLDCRSQQIEYVPFDSAELTVLITNSNVKHELTGTEYASRRADCDRALRRLGKASWRDVSLADLQRGPGDLSPTELRRAAHVVTEIERTRQAASAFRRRDWPEVGRLMAASHASLRDDFEVSCGELDCLVELAQQLGSEHGVYGSRMTGGGFGGCTVTLLEQRHLPQVVSVLTDRYLAATGITATCFATRPAAGAQMLVS